MKRCRSTSFAALAVIVYGAKSAYLEGSLELDKQMTAQ